MRAVRGLSATAVNLFQTHSTRGNHIKEYKTPAALLTNLCASNPAMLLVLRIRVPDRGAVPA